uniref:Uncharacterized protein n=1 Tax=viral metagenome TaxID=1070528 RepID=A0A6M3LSZ4_9ZZZZ
MDDGELDALGAFVHGWLAAFHALGVIYNWRRRNRADMLIHALALGYDTRAMLHHLKQAHQCKSISSP